MLYFEAVEPLRLPWPEEFRLSLFGEDQEIVCVSSLGGLGLSAVLQLLKGVLTHWL